jgi:hypothetical protein
MRFVMGNALMGDGGGSSDRNQGWGCGGGTMGINLPEKNGVEAHVDFWGLQRKLFTC